MTADRSRLRLVSAPRTEAEAPSPTPVEAAVRLAGSDRGAIVARPAAGGRPAIISQGLTPEEEAACLSLAQRLWQQPARGGMLASRLGGSTLLACALGAGEASGALVVALPGGGGRADAARQAAVRDVATLLSARLDATAAVEQAQAEAHEERRRAERALALNHALQALADTEDVPRACVNLLAELAPQFPAVDIWAVWLLEPDHRRLRVVAVRTAGNGSGRVPELPLGAGYSVDRVIESGQTLYEEFGRGAARTPGAKLARQFGIVSALQVPLRSRNAVVGILTVAAHRKHDFPLEERAFFETVGAQLGSQLDALRQLEGAESERERLRALIDTLPVGIAMFDAEGHSQLYNQALTEIWGHAPGVTPAHALLTADGRPLSMAESPIERAVSGGGFEGGRELIVRQPGGGQEVPVLVNAAPIRDPAGRLSGVIAVYQDITHLREIDRLRDDFINTVSHELRTPTTTVRGGALTLLRRGNQLDDAVKQQLLKDMAEEAERLYHLVEDLLGLQRVQAGMQLQTEPIIPHRFVNNVIIAMGGRVGNHALEINVPPDLPLIDADPTCLEQVLRNLIENAVKFSPKGRLIEIAAGLDGRNVVFSVLDRGSGIPAADMDRVFEPFYKTAEALRTGAQGAGLGLTVARRLVEIQGGHIWAEARPDGGTAFRFTLPALQEETE